LEFGLPVIIHYGFLPPLTGERPYGVIIQADRFVYAGWRNERRFPIGYDELPPERQKQSLEEHKVKVALAGKRTGEVVEVRLDQLELNTRTQVGALWFQRVEQGSNP